MVDQPRIEPLDAPAESPAGNGNTAAAAVELAEVQRERDEYKDLLLRARADFDNYRKRIERERLEQEEMAAADLLRDLLPIVDDLERALKAEPGEAVERYRQGVALIHQHLLDALRKRGVRPIEAVGTDFDPHFHQAVLHESVQGARDGEVIEEFRRGYMLGDRLLRPSMVKVAKG
jgi:molecular chaperone GrpE